MRVGTICYATSRGLGHLARDFHRKGLITDVMVVRHPGVPTNEDWYPGSWVTDLRRPDISLMKNFAASCEAMVFFETPFHWPLLDECRRMGVKTYLVTMYECSPVNHVRPDVYLCPSVLDMDYFEDTVWRESRERWRVRDGVGGTKAVWVQLPVEYPWRLRQNAFHFVHNGGYLGVKARGGVMREGTETVIRALPLVKSPIRLTVRVQENVSAELQSILAKDKRAEYVAKTIPYEKLYAEGDVAVGAQRWNGCSLPLQEQYAAGMLVMNTNRFPMNEWLPTPPLVPVSRYIPNSRIGGPYMTFDEADVTPEVLARTIDDWYGRDVTYYSERGRDWAKENSWDALLPEWKGVLGL